MVKKVPGPDAYEMRLRLGCGAMLGLLLVVPSAVRLSWRLDLPWLGWVVGGSGVVLCAVLAWRYGDAFWSGGNEDAGPWHRRWPRGPTRKK